MDLKTYLKTHPKTHLIFDLDETIAYLIIPWEKLLKEMSKNLKKIDSDLFHKVQKKGYYISGLENSYVKKYGKELKNLFIKNRMKLETENLKDIQVNRELVHFIKRNANEYRFYIWSSNMRPTVRRVLARVGIAQKFTKLITGQDVDFLKPDPEGFAKIKDPQIPQENYLMVGDNDLDRQAARAAGIDFYLETYFHRNPVSHILLRKTILP